MPLLDVQKEVISAAPRAKEIGERLKDLRKSRGLTLAQLAEKANLSVSSLSQTERGLVFPTVRTIFSVCEALAVSPAWVIDPDSAKDQNPDGEYIVRASGRTEILNTHGISKYIASPAKEERYKAFIVTVEPGGSTGDEPYTHMGEEIGIVLSGALVLIINGKEYRIAKGDTFAFPSNIPHRHFNESTTPTSIFWVNSRD